MNGSDRERVIQAFLAECANGPEGRVAKGEEYSVDGDVNGNFKRVAKRQKVEIGPVTLREVLMVWQTHFNKHLDSIENYIKDPDRKMVEAIDKRLGDAINYLAIGYSLIVEFGALPNPIRYESESDNEGED